ncbi:MAG TPA: nucleoside deaminase [Bacteroidia bacterium]
MEPLDLDTVFMQKALEQAARAFEEDEVPIGAIVIYKDRIIGKGYNQTEKLRDVTAHAEMLAITAASASLGNKYLEECTLYVTIEPCVMCAGAIKHSRLKRIVVGAPEPKTGFSNYLNQDFSANTELKIGVLQDECSKIMKDFFKNKR